MGFRCLVSGFGLVLCSKVQNFETRPSRVVNIEVSALNIYNVFYNSRFGSKGRDLCTF